PTPAAEPSADAATPRPGRLTETSSREPRGGCRDRRLAAGARFARPRARRPRGQARGRRPGPLPADTRGQEWRRLRTAQAPDDGCRRRDDGGRALGRPRRLAHHAHRPAAAQALARRAAAALERRPWGDERDRPTADAALP